MRLTSGHAFAMASAVVSRRRRTGCWSCRRGNAGWAPRPRRACRCSLVMMVSSFSSSTTGPTASWLWAANDAREVVDLLGELHALDFLHRRLGPGRLVRGDGSRSSACRASPPAAFDLLGGQRVALERGRPRIAPGPDWIVMWPNFNRRLGMRPLAVSCAAASPTTARSPSAAAPTVTPSPAGNHADPGRWP